MIRQLYEVQPRHELRDGSGKFWPERAIGRDSAINAAEVETALSRRRRATSAPVTPPPSRRTRTPWHKQPVIVPKELIYAGRKYTYAEAGAKCGISAAAMFKRIHKRGWPAAMIMGAAQ